MSPAKLSADTTDEGRLRVHLSGDWLLQAELPAPDPVLARVADMPESGAIDFDTDALGDWDTGLVTMLVTLQRAAAERGLEMDASALPDGARRLLDMAFRIGEREGARRHAEEPDVLERIGLATLDIADSGLELMRFTGELIYSAGRFVRGKATYLRSDLLLHLQEAGAEAFPIVSLISFLIGMIFAFVGVVQLNEFGAGIYTADLVAVAMVREMSAIMTAIIMAGRTGAAYAAQIGTMKVNEEIDALTTLGMNPIDYLVTPRVIALVLMMPLLTMYASLMGILGGLTVGLSMLDASLVQYVAQTVDAVDLTTLLGGLFKSVVYGSLVALAGCQQGIACGSSAMAVGRATTKAVVMGIVLIVVSASILTVIYINLGI